MFSISNFEMIIFGNGKIKCIFFQEELLLSGIE
jgi:hypothetical protein